MRRTFDASPDLVWQAFTVPELIRRWMLGPPGWAMPLCEMDVRPGGTYRWRWRNQEDTAEFGFAGEFREVDSPTSLVHTQIYDSGDLPDSMGEKESLVTVRFAKVADATRVTTTIAFATREDRDAALSTGMTAGMEMSYQQLDRVLG